MKRRLDTILVDLGIAADIDTARRLLRAGEVYVNDTVVDKPGSQIDDTATIRIKEKCPYVSRGGVKLEAALTKFNQQVKAASCIDVGASSGGFTDCLLQNGAKHVFAVDVAYGQLSWKIRQDSRVTVIERFNARKITPADIRNSCIDLAVMDVSFISLTKIIPPLLPLFCSRIAIIALVKPQFELAKTDIGPGGVVTDPALHQKAIEKIKTFAEEYKLEVKGVIQSPILGPKGNTEFLIHLGSW